MIVLVRSSNLSTLAAAACFCAKVSFFFLRRRTGKREPILGWTFYQSCSPLLRCIFFSCCSSFFRFALFRSYVFRSRSLPSMCATHFDFTVFILSAIFYVSQSSAPNVHRADSSSYSAASIPIDRWRQMRQGQFWGRNFIKSLTNFSIQQSI